MATNKCKYEFYLDEANKPVIETSNPDCQLLAIEALQSGDVTVKVKPRGAKAETEPDAPAAPVTES